MNKGKKRNYFGVNRCYRLAYTSQLSVFLDDLCRLELEIKGFEERNLKARVPTKKGKFLWMFQNGKYKLK